MRFFLSVFVVFCCSAPLCAQTDSLVATDTVQRQDSVNRPKSSIVRFSIRNRGGQVNGLNVSWSRYDVWRNHRDLYRVNGLDLAFLVDEQRINGMALALFWSLADTLNGVGCGLIGGTTEKGNGLFLYGIAGLSWTSINGVSAAGLWQINTAGNGVTVSGVSTVYDKSYNGLLLSGIYNRTCENFKGFGMAGAVQLFGDAKGVAASGVLTVVDENFSGFLFSGITSYVGDEFYGVGISAAVNRVSGETHGLLVSAINTTPVMQGVQIGIVNHTNRLQGVQLGLINVNRANPKGLRVLPFINCNFRPLHETDTIRKRNDSLYVLRSYNRNGRLASFSHYKSGKLEGVFTLYNSFNDKVRETNFHAGLKEGEEFFFDGAGRIEESSLYHVDTLVWSSTYDYPDNMYSEFTEKTIYYGKGVEAVVGLLGNDTLYYFQKNGGYRVERSFEEFGASIYKIYHRDSLADIIWVTEKWKTIDFNGPSAGTIIHIRPNAIPPAGIVLNVDVLEYAWSVSSVARNLESSICNATGHCFPLIVNGVNSHGRIVHQLILSGECTTIDSTSFKTHFPRKQQFRVFDKKGRTKLYMSDTAATTFYPSGKIRNRYSYHSTHLQNVETVFSYPVHGRRTDYYENGVKAFYQSQDTVCIWDTKGRLTHFEDNGTVRTYYENGKTEYEVTVRTLNYFDSNGQLLLSGTGDTLYTFRNGQQEEMLVISYDSIRVINSAAGVMKYNGSSRDYFRHEGEWIYRVISKEPLTVYGARYDEEDYTYNNWFGASVLRPIKGSEELWSGMRTFSPVGTPEWLELYFWSN